MTKTYVLYHANCWDGFCAAWVAHGVLGDENVEYIPVQYGQSPPNMTPGSNLLILDFSYKRPVMLDLCRKHDVVVLDHHRTATEELSGLEAEMVQSGRTSVIRFDMNRSGGRMAWEYFHPAESSPWLVDYTEDRDLWRWKLRCSREINASLRSLPLDFTAWDFLHANPDAIRVMMVEGAAILRRERQIINDHLRHAREIEMDGHKILAVNATVLFSDIAGELAEGRPFGACYFDRQDGKRQWSLRSRNDGVDVAEIARRHGGGGHKHAAGFEE